ncbi:MAG: OmpA family protein [Cytophagales bacterium]|nr:OmpA family protein [Cytophagales bacterium]
MATLLNEKPTLEVEIAGHTDPIGTGEYNMGLSERRAKSVTRYLVSKGISEKRITTSYFGETRLIDTK